MNDMNDVAHPDVFQALQRLDRSGLPKYQRLAQALVEGMRNGHWRPGDRLPTEESLVEMTLYSLGTVQRALRELADQRLVVRQHGLGSFVAEPARELPDPWHLRFVDDDGRTILPIFSRALSRSAVHGGGEWSRHLGPNAQVMRLDRIITVNDEFRIFSRFYGDRQLLRQMWEMPLDSLHGANFRQVIVDHCHLPITDITRLVTQTSFDDEVAERAGVEAGTDGLRLQAIGRAGRDTGVYYQEFFIPPTRRPLQFAAHASQDA